MGLGLVYELRAALRAVLIATSAHWMSACIRIFARQWKPDMAAAGTRRILRVPLSTARVYSPMSLRALAASAEGHVSYPLLSNRLTVHAAETDKVTLIAHEPTTRRAEQMRESAALLLIVEVRLELAHRSMRLGAAFFRRAIRVCLRGVHCTVLSLMWMERWIRCSPACSCCCCLLGNCSTSHGSLLYRLVVGCAWNERLKLTNQC